MPAPALLTHLKEFVRCTRHNWAHLRTFRVSYLGGGVWRVRDGDVSMVFPHYPYLAFHDIEGYIRQGRWRPEPGQTVIDAGGCAGEFALYAAKRVGPAGRVLMLEPDPGNVAAARRLFEMNGAPANLEIVPAGLWSRPGKLRFGAGHGAQSAVIADAGGSTNAAATVNDVGTGGDTIEIDVHSLASLVAAYGLARLDFVKMDIEGAELEAVAAAADLPPTLRPRYAIASYHVVNGSRTADVLGGIFAKLGYRAESGYPAHLTTWASPESR